MNNESNPLFKWVSKEITEMFYQSIYLAFHCCMWVSKETIPQQKQSHAPKKQVSVASEFGIGRNHILFCSVASSKFKTLTHWIFLWLFQRERLLLPFLKLTQHLKMDGWKTTFLLGWRIFQGYFSFREFKVSKVESRQMNFPSPKTNSKQVFPWNWQQASLHVRFRERRLQVYNI